MKNISREQTIAVCRANTDKQRGVPIDPITIIRANKTRMQRRSDKARDAQLRDIGKQGRIKTGSLFIKGVARSLLKGKSI
jgi:hypothetical protein